jgi:ADP-heptose:LPS heptosyltransferase
MEISRARFAALRDTYKNLDFVKCYNVSSVPLEKFPTEQDVTAFYSGVETALNNYPLDIVLDWLHQDKEYVSGSGVPRDGIQKIKRENGIETFDLVLIDGSEFTGSAELEEVYGARIIILDDVNAYKNYFNYRRLKFDSNYVLVTENWSLRNGYAIFRLAERQMQQSEFETEGACTRTPITQSFKGHPSRTLPVHFFTIVLNGKPFIEKHISIFEKLPFPWHWHIIEGVAAFKNDTIWSIANGGRIDDSLHKNGLSNDGTSEYLDDLVKQYPGRVTVYRKKNGAFAEGKLEMVQIPAASIKEECLLWQVDADEFWTAEQICTARDMFIQYPEKTAAFYLCNFFVGPRLVTTTFNTYGNHLGNEWIRTWRFKPGDYWLSHEPPRLVRQAGEEPIDLSTINPFKHAETMEKGLIFHHYAYVTEEQIRFKEVYYGYKGAVEQWRTLLKAESFPVELRDYFAWVKDETQVDRFEGETFLSSSPERILWIRTDAIGDNVLASAMLPYVRNCYPEARITVLCQDRIEPLYQASPFVDQVISYNWRKAFHEEAYRQEVLDKVQAVNADLTLNSVFSRDALTDYFAIGSFAPERIALHGDESNIREGLRDENNSAYTRIIDIEGSPKSEMERHRDFLRGLGIDAPPLQPLVWTAEEDERFAEEFFLRHGLDPQKTVAFYPSGQWEGKFYNQYPEALTDLFREKGLSVIMFGGGKERDLNNRLLDELGVPGVNAAGETTIRQTAAIIRRCRIGVGADTGTAHIACAVGTPHVVLLWGGHFGRFFPYSPLTSVVCLPLECYGCNWLCPYTRPHCVKDIHPSVVETAIRETLTAVSELPRIFAQDYDSWRPGPGEPGWDLFTRFIDTRSVAIVPVSGDQDSRTVNFS